MAVSRVKTSSILQGFPKSRSLLAGNAAYVPTSFDSIATINATGTTATFSSIPSTYKSLQLRYMFNDAGGNTPYIRPNADTSSVYANHSIDGNGATAYAQNSVGGGNGFINMWGTSTSSTQFMGGITDIIDYADTSKFKTIRSITGYDNNGSGAVSLTSNLWRSTSAISSLVIVCPGGFVSGSTLALYGIKG